MTTQNESTTNGNNSSTCCCGNHQDGGGDGAFSFMAAILVVIVCDEIFTEIGLGYLLFHDIHAKLYITILHRIVVLLALVTTAPILWYLNKKKKDLDKNELNSLMHEKKHKCRNLHQLHSVIFCAGFLLSSLLLLTTIQDDFDRYQEVVVKLTVVIFDMTLTLMFAKLSMDTFSSGGDKNHPQEGDIESNNNTFTPHKKNTKEISVTKDNNGYKYTLLE